MMDFGNMFNGMLRQVGRNQCKMGANGKVAINIGGSYKTFDIKSLKLINCDNFAFDMDGMFWVVPTFKVAPEDIIFINGKPHAVIEVNEKTIKAFSYENSTIVEVVPEHHVFMGKTYCYGKIFSPLMNMDKSDNMMQNMMSMMMMSQMFSGNNSNSNSAMNFMPFMMMGNSNNPFMNMFEGAFNFGDAETDTKEDK